MVSMHALDTTGLDLTAYLARIGITGPLDTSRPTLDRLHRAHATHIPFENLEVLMGKPIPLDVAHLSRKLVHAKRGGYCFEQNILFWAVMQSVGFHVRPLAARVRYKTQRILPRTHMLLLVEGLGTPVIADVGFGGEGPLSPLDLAAGVSAQHLHWSYRLVASGDDVWTLQTQDTGTWIDLYVFDLQPQELPDLEMAHYYTSTHPNSRFRQTLAVQCIRDGRRLSLRNRDFTVDTGPAKTTRTLKDHAEVLQVLTTDFGLPVPPTASFKYDVAF
jgi:N-hydroxyarylamine O-acetyltransferase